MTGMVEASVGRREVLAGFFRRHWAWYRGLGAWAFLGAVTAEGLLVSLVVVWVVQAVVGRTADSLDFHMETLDAFLLLCVFAPLWETFAYQVVPVGVMRLFRGRLWVQVAGSVVVFMVAHGGRGMNVVVGAGLVGGFYFAFTYTHWRAVRGVVVGYGMTAGSHFLHNFVLFGLLWAGGTFAMPVVGRVEAGGLEGAYVTGAKGEYVLTVAAERVGRTLGPFEAGAVPRVMVEVGGERWSWSGVVEMRGEVVRLDGADFELRRGRFFYATYAGGGVRWEQFDVPVEAGAFGREGAGAVRGQVGRFGAARGG